MGKGKPGCRAEKRKDRMKQYLTAIVEDDPSYAEYLKDCLTRYGQEHDCGFQIRSFGRAEAFLEGAQGLYDLVFMDVELGDGWMNGIEAARALRAAGSMAMLFFITNMPQYAPSGYDVDAIDYCIKPINYRSLSVKLDKALKILKNRSGVPVKIRVRDGLKVVFSADIHYIEVMGHDLMFHTEQEVITAYGGLREREKDLKDQDFARCSASVLVNLRYVNGLFGDEVSVGSERIRIGRSRKKEFMASLNKYLGG